MSTDSNNFLPYRCITAHVLCEGYTNQKLINSPGLYFENLGPISYYTSTWDLVTHIDISQQTNHLITVKTIFNSTKKLCSLIMFNTERTLCLQTMQLISSKIPQLSLKEKSLYEFLGTSRTKRGLFNGIGTIFKTIIGTLDNDDAEYYSNAINQAQIDHANTLVLLKDQVQIVNSTIDNYKETTRKFENIIEQLNLNAAKINDFSKNIMNLTESLKYTQISLEQTSLLTFMIQELENEFDSLISALMFAQLNQIHPRIITPSQFVLELSKTTSHLASSTKYPLSLIIENAHDLMSIVKLTVFQYKNKIIFIICNPIIYDKNFILYHLIPLPSLRPNSTHIFIQPNSKYLATSTDKSLYTTTDSLDDCKLIRNLRVCNQNNLIYNHHTHSTCESELIYNSKFLSKSCNLHIVNSLIKIWHKLALQNEWIYVFSLEEPVTITCNGTNENLIYLQGTGIFKLNQNCEAFTSSTTLIPQKSFSSNYSSFIPNFNLSDNINYTATNIGNIVQNFRLQNKIQYSHINLDNIKSISNQLSKLDNEITEEGFNKNSPYIVNVYQHYIIMILFIVSIIIFYIVYLKLSNMITFKNLRKRHTKPLPQDSSDSIINNLTQIEMTDQSSSTTENNQLECQNPIVNTKILLGSSLRTSP